MILVLCFILLILLFIMPFIPGMRELRKNDNTAALFINMDYCKDPRYFAISFRKIFSDSLNKGGCDEGLCSIRLSKQEVVKIADNASVADATQMSTVFYVKHKFSSGGKAVFEKELFVGGDVCVGEDNQLRSLVSDGDVHVLRGTKFTRWLDAEGSIRIDEGCDLGISATCSKELSLASKCSFKRLYGFPVVTGAIGFSAQENDMPDGATAIREAAAALVPQEGIPDDGMPAVFTGEATERDLTEIAPHERKECTIITDDSLVIGEYAVIQGHVKTHGKLSAGASVIITGNLFAEGDIHLGPHSRVFGTVFTQGRIVLEEGVIIGSPGRIKSVIAKKGIALHSGVKVYGYVMTEGEGVVA